MNNVILSPHRCFTCNKEFDCGAYVCEYIEDGSIPVFCSPTCSKNYYSTEK